MRYQIVCLPILSVATLCLKAPQIGNDTIHPEFFLTVGGDLLEQSFLGFGHQKNKNSPSSINNHLLFDVETVYSRIWERERESERERDR